MNILETIKSKQLLKGIALDVYTILTQFDGLTVGEITKKYQAMRPKFKRGRNEIAKRVRELETWGAIEKIGIANCELTGRKVSAYGVTGNLPVRTTRRLAKKALPLQKATLSPTDAQALSGERDSRLAAAKSALEQTVANASALSKQVSTLLTAVAVGEGHFQALRRLQAEKAKQIRSFFISKARKAKLKKELDAIDYILNTASYIKGFGSVI